MKRLPLPLVKMIARVTALCPRFVFALRYYRWSKKIIDWHNPRNLQEFSMCQLFSKEISLDFFAMLADKVAVRNFVKERIGEKYLNKLYGTWDSADKIDFKQLPDRFVLKLLSGGVAVTVYYIASLMGKTIALLTTPLNSVIIGYLAKSRKEMTAGRWTRIVGMCIIAGGVILLVCVAASHIVIRILYPSEFDMAEPLFMLANLAQIVYFMTGILTTILLRYVEERQQLNITLAYVIAFAAIVLPVTWKYKLWGFAYAILVVNTFRFIYVFFVMFK